MFLKDLYWFQYCTICNISVRIIKLYCRYIGPVVPETIYLIRMYLLLCNIYWYARVSRLWWCNLPKDVVLRGMHKLAVYSLQWRHNGHDGVSNHQPYQCLRNRLFGADQRKHQSSASLAFVRGIHRRPVNSPHKWPVTRKMLPFHDVIMFSILLVDNAHARMHIPWRSSQTHEVSTPLINNNMALKNVLCDYKSMFHPISFSNVRNTFFGKHTKQIN